MFLFDWDADAQTGTRVDAGFKLLADHIALNFEVFDSIGLGTSDARATIDADGNVATNPELAMRPIVRTS